MWDGNLWLKTFRLAGMLADLGKIKYHNRKIELETSEKPKRGTGSKGGDIHWLGDARQVLNLMLSPTLPLIYGILSSIEDCP